MNKRDYTLIIDRSGSMAIKDQPGGRSRWATARESAHALAARCEELDPDGITLYVFGSKFRRYDNVTADRVGGDRQRLRWVACRRNLGRVDGGRGADLIGARIGGVGLGVRQRRGHREKKRRCQGGSAPGHGREGRHRVRRLGDSARKPGEPRCDSSG